MKLRDRIRHLFWISYDWILMEIHWYWAKSLVKQYHDIQSKLGYPEGYPYDGMQEIEHKYNPNLRIFRLRAIYHFRKNKKYLRRMNKRSEKILNS